MMLNMKLYRTLNKLNDDNFVYPIRKEPNVKLATTEFHFNTAFGSFRSGIKN